MTDIPYSAMGAALVITAGILEALGKERVGRESPNPPAQVLSSGKGPTLISGQVACPVVSHGLLFPLPHKPLKQSRCYRHAAWVRFT